MGKFFWRNNTGNQHLSFIFTFLKCYQLPFLLGTLPWEQSPVTAPWLVLVVDGKVKQGWRMAFRAKCVETCNECCRKQGFGPRLKSDIPIRHTHNLFEAGCPLSKATFRADTTMYVQRFHDGNSLVASLFVLFSTLSCSIQLQI